ncbi:hypothetical protein VTK56DRAFT_6767 [Thermocarpiscus australiensis]
MLFLTAAVVAIAGLCQAQLRWTGETVVAPGRIKNPEAFSAAVANSGLGLSGVVQTLGAAVFRLDASLTVGSVAGRDLELSERQSCPPTHPVPCDGGLCCQATYPVCCIEVNGGCCPSDKPVCVTDGCCASGTTLCPNDPDTCHTPDEVCCGGGTVCPVGRSCCGTGACCSETDTESNKCCPGSTAALDTCCGEYEVCCDGWCCYEGSTCGTEPGYCNIPVLEFGYDPNGITADLVENVCLGIRGQIAMGRPDTTPNEQILTYYGPNSPNRELTDCRRSRECCRGQTVPPGEPGAGDNATCDEYPFSSTIEGGPGAHVACVDEYANAAGGDLIRQMVSGMHRGFKYALRVTGIDCNAVVESDVHPCNPLP